MQVEAEATHLPTEIEVSVQGLDAGAHITAGDLTLPAGATLVTDAETLLLNVSTAPTAEDIEADTAESIADLGIVEEPADDPPTSRPRRPERTRPGRRHRLQPAAAAAAGPHSPPATQGPGVP